MEFPEGSRLTAEFVRFIRPEMKFDSLGELQRQIARDIASLQLN
jgi:FAD synthase